MSEKRSERIKELKQVLKTLRKSRDWWKECKISKPTSFIEVITYYKNQLAMLELLEKEGEKDCLKKKWLVTEQ